MRIDRFGGLLCSKFLKWYKVYGYKIEILIGIRLWRILFWNIKDFKLFIFKGRLEFGDVK